ncbi:hypothetical protein GH714_008440 [Hevea brasiliensis]|uniref:Reverse transcriptase Ty1/copia-type domain-containing protein n=1 Tax=Hevea brasiliensis TaxID=3981 RepID=A0A6A6KCL1_HEVBR|nr:hypothetical protein GH714_008440 [Hevea brasiliensis]
MEMGLKLVKEPDGRKVDNTLQADCREFNVFNNHQSQHNACCQLSRYMEHPKEIHLLAAKRILRSKHIDVKFHFLRDLTKDGVIDIVYCRSEEQVADLFTKPLKMASFVKLRKLLGVCTLEDPD